MTAQPATPGSDSPVTSNRGLTIAGVVLAFLLPLLGLILSIVALVQSRGAGQKNGMAVAGIIISIVWPIIAGIAIAAIVAATGAGVCTVTVNGVTQAC